MVAATPTRRPYAPRMAPADRREQLLDAACTLALTSSFHQVTVDGVARAAGVTRPVVYSQFADRNELLLAMVDRAERRALDQLTRVLPAVPDPGASTNPDRLLVEGLTAYLGAIRDDPDTWRVVLLPPEGAPAELRERVRTQHHLVLRALRDLIGWGLQARGGPQLDVDLMARTVLTLAEGAGRLVLSDPATFGVERFAAFAHDLLAALAPATGR
ncbi:MAG: TetR/AcrR family transcriptional regulator [Actinomycetota bacterium]|nr:TetR/AcrR family transcriptional regulator [Actinomycetota bacterium]